MMVYPDKCILCRKVLEDPETDLCHHCRESAPVFTKSKKRFSFVAGWTSLWYYKGTARSCILRFKFGKGRVYAPALGRLLAMKLSEEEFDILTYVPVSWQRKLGRGYDQTQILAKAAAKELGVPLIPCLIKQRHTKPQSRLPKPEQRRANISGAYRVRKSIDLAGKRILLIDDIITTGATISEAARTLLTAGAGQVRAAALAVSPDDNDKNKM